jgi:hypothetical protein
MNPLDSERERSFSARLPDLLIHLGLSLGQAILNPSGLNSSVPHQHLQGNPSHLASEGIEARNHHRVGLFIK